METHRWSPLQARHATAPCTAPLPGGGTQTFANCTTVAEQRREISLYNPAIGQYYGYVDYVTDAGWQDYQGLQLSIQRRLTSGLTTSANYTVSRCEGLISQGQSPLNVATGYSRPISMLNPPSEAEPEGKLRDRQGALRFLAGAHLQSHRELRDAASSATRPRAYSRLTGGWRESSVRSRASR